MVKEFLNKNKYVILGVLIIICLFIKCFLGIGWDDEGYYLSVTHRFFMGEIPLYDEWFPSQLSSILLLPVYSLFRGIVGSGEGIVLFFRLFYLFLLILNSSFVFYVIRKYSSNSLVAFFSAVLLLIYSTENKALYSYNDLAVAFLSLSIILLLYNEIKEKKSNLLYFASGISFVLMVFSNPYTIVIYIYFVIIMFITRQKQKNKKIYQYGLLFTVGCCVIGFAFIGYLLLKVPVSNLLKAFEYIVAYPGYEDKNIFLRILKWCWYACKPYGLIVLSMDFLLFLYVIIQSIKKQWTLKKRTLCFLAQWVFTFIYIFRQYFFMEEKNVIGIAYIPLAILGFLCFIIMEKKEWKILILVYIPGILMSIAFQCSSTTGIFAMTTGFTISAMGSVIIIFKFLEQNYNKKNYNLNIGLISIILGITLCTRIVYCRYNVYEQEYNCMIDKGPYKGIITDFDQKQFYDDSLKDLDWINDNTSNEDNILILGNNMWMYLYLDRNIGAPTTWRMNSNNVYCQAYFEFHPDKMPKVIYSNLFSDEYGSQMILLNNKVYEEIYNAKGQAYTR